MRRIWSSIALLSVAVAVLWLPGCRGSRQANQPSEPATRSDKGPPPAAIALNSAFHAPGQVAIDETAGVRSSFTERAKVAVLSGGIVLLLILFVRIAPRRKPGT